MNFPETMKKFWARYLKELRQEVEQSLAYQEAANAEDLIKAQETACRLIEGGGRNKREAKDDRMEKRLERLMRAFEEENPN